MNGIITNAEKDRNGNVIDTSYLDLKGKNVSFTINCPIATEQRYICILKKTIPAWNINNAVIAICSRHAGSGILTIQAHGVDADKVPLMEVGFKGGMTSSIYLLNMNEIIYCYNETTRLFTVWYRAYDYNSLYAVILHLQGFTINDIGKEFDTLSPEEILVDDIPTYGKWYSINVNYANTIQSRKINGTSFNATSDIVTTQWGSNRGVTIGKTKKNVNGSTDYNWTLDEIGALPLTGRNFNRRLNS